MATLDSTPTEEHEHGKTLQYTRRGLKMVGKEKSLFDLDEPVWHADEKVGRTLACVGHTKDN